MTAEKLTAAFENLPTGEPWADARAAAESANDAERAAAAAALFHRELVPTSKDTIALYASLIENPSTASVGTSFASYHERALAGHPELSRLFRSPEALADVSAAGARTASPAHNLETQAAAGARAASEARAQYMLAIASQLADVPGHDLAKPAKALLACDDRARRIAAATARHEQHAVTELARLAVERKAAARAVRDRTAERVREAERKAADAAQIAGLAAAEYRKVRADAFVERLRESGLHELRVGEGLYGVADLISTAGGMSLQHLERVEAALERGEVE